VTDETHDPARTSWVASANVPGTDFPIQNLPFAVFRRAGSAARIGVAIGDQILDLALCARAGLVPQREICGGPSLLPVMELAPASRAALRTGVSELLRSGSPERPELLVPMAAAELLLPCAIGDYTDFYASIHHAMNVGRLFRPDNPLPPNYRWVPVAYHGRASSIVPSGTPVRRPRGQMLAPEGDRPRFALSAALDYELEVGFFVGRGNPLGEPIPVDRAEEHIFGFCLVNDWSARDIQRWEYQPLGPFLGKSFATTISPWVVTVEALAPFRAPAAPRGTGDPEPLDYLAGVDSRERGAFAIALEVRLSTALMRRRGATAVCLARSQFASLYWTPAQMLAHHASNGCNLRTGDLLASGTVSGTERDSVGSMLELAAAGEIELTGGERRSFLEDGDEVILTGRCERAGFVSIGFGECRGLIVAASPEARDGRPQDARR
jgi:fumarylacetoacetase